MMEELNNPLDSAEDFLNLQEWAFQRLDDDQLYFTVEGDRGTYRVLFIWDEQQQAMQYCCELGLNLDEDTMSEGYKVIGELNSKLWLGHFDLTMDKDKGTYSPCFRYTSLMPSQSVAYMKELISYTLQECERLYDVFSILDEGKVLPHSEKMQLIMQEAVGSC